MSAFVLYDLVKRQFGPTSDRHDLLGRYDWARHDPRECAVLPTRGGGVLRVALADANAARRRLGIRYEGDVADAAVQAAQELAAQSRREAEYDAWYGPGAYRADHAASEADAYDCDR